jgi:two-component system sensor histidine kinase ResE
MFAVGLPARAIVGELRQVFVPMLPTTALALLLGGALAYTLACRVREPILRLASAVTHQQQGDLSTPIPIVEEAEPAVLAQELELARRAAEQRLERAAQRDAQQLALFDALREPAILTSRDGRIAESNPAAQAFFGGTVQLYGRPIQELLPFVSLPSDEMSQSVHAEGRAVDATGRTVDLDVSLAYLPDEHDAATCVYVLHNVSRYAEANRLREQLLYSVAHELRGPLSVLDNALELLASERDTISEDEADRLVQSARRTAARLRSLMEDMLSAGAIQSGRFAVVTQRVELAPIINAAIDAVRLTVERRKQRVTCDLIQDGVRVHADRRYIEQVLINLLTNASKYSPDSETIRVTAHVGDSEVKVAVIDQGVGIPPEEQNGLFERFYRVRLGNDEPGIGLGLAIAKGIIDAHRGSIGLHSEPGGGTVVWFTLPLDQEATPSAEPPPHGSIQEA